MGNGEGRIRTHYLGVAERNVARQLPLSNNSGLSVEAKLFHRLLASDCLNDET